MVSRIEKKNKQITPIFFTHFNDEKMVRFGSSAPAPMIRGGRGERGGRGRVNQICQIRKFTSRRGRREDRVSSQKKLKFAKKGTPMLTTALSVNSQIQKVSKPSLSIRVIYSLLLGVKRQGIFVSQGDI